MRWNWGRFDGSTGSSSLTLYTLLPIYAWRNDCCCIRNNSVEWRRIHHHFQHSHRFLIDRRLLCSSCLLSIISKHPSTSDAGGGFLFWPAPRGRSFFPNRRRRSRERELGAWWRGMPSLYMERLVLFLGRCHKRKEKYIFPFHQRLKALSDAARLRNCQSLFRAQYGLSFQRNPQSPFCLLHAA